MPFLSSMNLAHLHLLLNHIPTVGSVAALGLLLLAFVRRDQHLKHVGLEVLFVVAVLTLPAYVTGAAASHEIRKMPDLNHIAIRVHQDAALFGFAVLEIAGFVGWVALWHFRRHGRPGPGLVPAATGLLVLALALMGRAANLGGEIRHPEILVAAASASEENAGEPAAADASADQPALSAAEGNGAEGTDGEGDTDDKSKYVAAAITQVAVYSPWAWPAAEAVHFLGLALSFGVLLAINLRILGAMRQVPFADIHRLLPWGMLGFGANLITGMFFFVGQPGQYVESAPFYWKILLLMIAGFNFLYLTVFKKAWNTSELGLADKAMAVVSLISWLGVLYAGRMLPFLGKSF